MTIQESLYVGQRGYVRAEQLWLTAPRSVLFVEPQFFVGEGKETRGLLPVVRTLSGYVLSVPADPASLNVQQEFPHRLSRYITLVRIEKLSVPGRRALLEVRSYFA